MNRKQFTILLVLVVVLGGAGLIISRKQSDTAKSGDPTLGQKLLRDFPVNDVTQITIREGANELHLVKKDELWRVPERGDYPANYSEISDALLKLKDLKVLQSEQVGPSQLGRVGLAAGQGPDSAVVVEFKNQAGKSLGTLLLGKKHMRKAAKPNPQFGGMGGDEGWPDGRYVKVGADAASVALISDPLASLEAKPEQWLSKDFIKVEKIRSATASFPLATNSWKLARETEAGEWKLAEAKAGEQLDTAKVSGLSSALSSASFADVTSAAPATLGLDKPTTVTLDTFDNFTYTLKVGQKTNDNYPLTFTVAAQLAKERAPGKDEKAEDKDKLDKEFKEQQQKLQEKLAQEKAYEKWTYLVSSWTLDSLLKERSQLMAEKKEEPKPEAGATNAPLAIPGLPPQ